MEPQVLVALGAVVISVVAIIISFLSYSSSKKHAQVITVENILKNLRDITVIIDNEIEKLHEDIQNKAEAIRVNTGKNQIYQALR